MDLQAAQFVRKTIIDVLEAIGGDPDEAALDLIDAARHEAYPVIIDAALTEYTAYWDGPILNYDVLGGQMWDALERTEHTGDANIEIPAKYSVTGQPVPIDID